jgi:TolB-like protein
MLRTSIALALAACLPACAPAAAPTAEPGPTTTVSTTTTTTPTVPVADRPGVAVFPFTNGGSFGRGREDLAALEVGIQQMLLTELHQNTGLRIVERSALRDMLGEQDLGTAGRVDAATAARVGRLVGARYAITGTFMDLNGNFRLDGRIVDVETGEILRAVRIENQRRDHLYRLLVDLAQQITAGVNLPPLARAAQQERRARNVPDEATTMYSRALIYAENGDTEQAIELYRQIVRRFPDYTEAREELRQMEEDA